MGCILAISTVYATLLIHIPIIYADFSNIYLKLEHFDKNEVYFSNIDCICNTLNTYTHNLPRFL